MSACEACVIACGACPREPGTGRTPATEPGFEAAVCIQLCELALHAMSNGGAIVPAACTACARACEALARHCMLLGQPTYHECARACYRAARECYRLAAMLREELAAASASRQPPRQRSANAMESRMRCLPVRMCAS